MKTLIAIPCMDQVPVPFCSSLAMLRKVGETSLAIKTGSLIYAARNDLALMAIEAQADYVLWLDSDMVFPPDTMIRMMDTMQKNDLDILTGLYFRRLPPYTPVLFDQLEFDEDDVLHFSDFKEIPEELFEVGGCGFGCVLMKTDVFMDVLGKYQQLFAPMGNNGEDVAFCVRARQCGYKIYCDPKLICGHVSYAVVDDKFFRAFGGENGNNRTDRSSETGGETDESCV